MALLSLDLCENHLANYFWTADLLQSCQRSISRIEGQSPVQGKGMQFPVLFYLVAGQGL